jgi:hypothetical protein
MDNIDEGDENGNGGNESPNKKDKEAKAVNEIAGKVVSAAMSKTKAAAAA